MLPEASMENFHPLTPYHTAVLNSAHCCAKFAQDCAEVGAQEIVPNLLSALEKKKHFVHLC